MASSFDEKIVPLNRLTVRTYNKVVDGSLSVMQGLSVLGNWGERTIKQKITTLDSPPNAPATVAKKGVNNPLIEQTIIP